MSQVRDLAAWAPSQPATEVPIPAGLRLFRIALCLFIAVVVARIHEVVPGLASLRPAKLLALPILLALVVVLPRWQLLSVAQTTTAKCVGVMALMGLLSIPLSLWPSQSALFFVNSLVPSAVLFIACAVGFADRKTARLCILTLALTVTADAIYLLVGPAPVTVGRPYIGVTLDPNDSAALFVATIPFAALLASGGRARRLLAIAVAMVLVAGVVKTGSRGGLVGLFVVALALVLRAKSRRRWAHLLTVAAGAVVFFLSADEAQLTRFRTIFAPRSDYNFTERDGRVQVWKRGVRYMLTNPVLGVGLNNFQTAEGVLSGKTRRVFGGLRYTASHNAFVQIGAELGVIGLAAFIIAMWSAGRGCRRVQQLSEADETLQPQTAGPEAKLAVATYAALLGTAATALFLSLAYHPITYFVLAVCVGVAAGSYSHKQPRARRSRHIHEPVPAREVIPIAPVGGSR